MSCRILIVEDEKIVQLHLRQQLRRLGYVVAGVASSGLEAISKAAEVDPDLVLMDIQLQGTMDGIEAARQICASREVPVIYLSAFNPASLGKDIKGREQYLGKPFHTTELQSLIVHVLKQERGSESSHS